MPIDYSQVEQATSKPLEQLIDDRLQKVKGEVNLTDEQWERALRPKGFFGRRLRKSTRPSVGAVVE